MTKKMPSRSLSELSKVKVPNTCIKCNGNGWYAYDHNHSKPCEICCQHSEGWWELKEHYGTNNGKYACKSGCGETIEPELAIKLNKDLT